MHHDKIYRVPHALFLSLLFVFPPPYAQSFLSHSGSRKMCTTCGLCSPTRHIRIARGKDIRLCGDPFLHLMEHCPRLPVALPSAPFLDHLTLCNLCPLILQMIQFALSICISNNVMILCLSSLFAVFPAMFPIPIALSFSYNCSGKRIRFSTHCPSVFNPLTLFIYSAIIYFSAVMVIRFFAE
jgi:hypothetical protein